MSHALKLAHFISISKNAFLFPFAGKLISQRAKKLLLLHINDTPIASRPTERHRFEIGFSRYPLPSLLPLFPVILFDFPAVVASVQYHCDETKGPSPSRGGKKKRRGLHPFLLLFLSRDISKFNLKLTGGGRENSNREATTTSTWLVNFDGGGGSKTADFWKGRQLCGKSNKVRHGPSSKDRGWAPPLLALIVG